MFTVSGMSDARVQHRPLKNQEQYPKNQHPIPEKPGFRIARTDSLKSNIRVNTVLRSASKKNLYLLMATKLLVK